MKSHLIRELKRQHFFFDNLRYLKNRLTDQRTKRIYKRFNESITKKDSKLIRKEFAELKKYWGVIPDYYISLNFYEKNCSLSLDDMKEYIPSYYFYYVICPIYDDTDAVTPLVENKIRAQKLFLENDIPVAPSIEVGLGKCNELASGEELDDEQLTHWLNSSEIDKLFIKPVSGRGGRGILVATRRNGEFYVDNQVVNYAFLTNLPGSYIAEYGIIQSDYISAVYSKSVNTLRVITKKDPNTNQVTILSVILRIGLAGAEVDNGSQGGIMLALDCETGQPIYGVAMVDYGHQKLPLHPDSGYPFSEFFLRDWPNFRKNIISIAERFTTLNLAGWDFAITDNGPVVIEVNTFFGIDHAQAGGGGFKEHFVEGNPKLMLKRSNR